MSAMLDTTLASTNSCSGKGGRCTVSIDSSAFAKKYWGVYFSMGN